MTQLLAVNRVRSFSLDSEQSFRIYKFIILNDNAINRPLYLNEKVIFRAPPINTNLLFFSKRFTVEHDHSDEKI